MNIQWEKIGSEIQTLSFLKGLLAYLYKNYIKPFAYGFQYSVSKKSGSLEREIDDEKLTSHYKLIWIHFIKNVNFQLENILFYIDDIGVHNYLSWLKNIKR